MAAFLAACEGEPDGIEPGMPIELDASDIEVVGTSDVLAVVRDMEVLDDGSVWVLTSGSPISSASARAAGFSALTAGLEADPTTSACPRAS